jgi:hypothetical protein
MTRTLGSFNRRVRLQQHSEDHETPAMPQIARFQTRLIPEDVNNPSGGVKFAASRGRPGGERLSRFAGAVLNIDLRKNEQAPDQKVTFSAGLPSIQISSPVGAAELRAFNS